MNKAQKRVLFGAYTVALLIMSKTCISLVLANISESFPDASQAAVQMVFVLANGAGLIGSVLAGSLSSRMSSKSILVLLTALMLAAGLLGYFFHSSLILLYIVSILLGISTGGSDPISTALISESCDETIRAKAVGLKSVFLSIGGFLITYLAGILAASQWHNVYLVFLLAFPVLIVLLFVVPKPVSSGSSAGQQAADDTNQKLLNPRVKEIYITAIIVAVTWSVYNNNVSFLLEGNAAMSSYVTMVFMASMTVTGFFIELIRKVWKSYANVLCMLTMALSLWIFTQSFGNVALLCIGSALLGFGFCAYTALAFSSIPEIATPGKITKTMTYYSAISTGGQLLHPYLITEPLTMISDSPVIRFYACAIILTIGTAYAFMIKRKDRKVS